MGRLLREAMSFTTSSVKAFYGLGMSDGNLKSKHTLTLIVLRPRRAVGLTYSMISFNFVKAGPS